MTADFSGTDMTLPPGIVQGPQVRDEFPTPVWWSPSIKPSQHLLVGGRTVWVESGVRPAAVVVAHPNRFGCGEDLAGLSNMADRYGAEGWVIVDPLLTALVHLPARLRSATSWPESNEEILTEAGLRSLQAADGLRRRLQEAPGLSWPVQYQAGRTVTCITPLTATTVKEALSAVGVSIGGEGWWQGLVTFTVGWWHRRDQLDGLAAAITAVLTGRGPEPVTADTFDRIPDDLPRRRLNRIMTNLRGG